MTGIDVALSRWVRRSESSPLDLAPKLWSAHWGNGLLGEFGIPRIETSDMGQAVFWMLTPFAFCPAVLTSFIIVDVPPKLYAARLGVLSESGVTTYWEIPYSIDDSGTTRFRDAEKTPWKIDRIPEALSVIVQRRLERGNEYDFEDLFTQAVAQIEAM